MSKKNITGYINLTIPAGSAKPSPPVGPALGQRGLNIMDFCKQFNAATSEFEKETPIPVVISVYQDRTFSFITKTPPASFLIRKLLGIQKGSSQTKKEERIGQITLDQCKEIAKKKIADLNAKDLDQAAKIIAGSAESMGVKVV